MFEDINTDDFLLPDDSALEDCAIFRGEPVGADSELASHFMPRETWDDTPESDSLWMEQASQHYSYV